MVARSLDTDSEIAAIDRQIQELQIIRRYLIERKTQLGDQKDLYTHSVGVVGNTIVDVSTRKRGGRGSGKVTNAILELVRREPGLKMNEVAHKLSHVPESATRAKGVRSVYNTAHGMVNRGKLTKDSSGGLAVAK